LNSIENLLYKNNKQSSLLKRRIKKFLLQHQEQLRIKYVYLEQKCKKDKVSKEQLLSKLKIKSLLRMIQRRQMVAEILIHSIQFLSRTSFLVLTYNSPNLIDNFNIFGSKKTSDYLINLISVCQSIRISAKLRLQGHQRLKVGRKIMEAPANIQGLKLSSNKGSIQKQKFALHSIFLSFNFKSVFYHINILGSYNWN